MIDFIDTEISYSNGTKIGPINLNIKAGEVHLFAGKSGSGKTSICKLVGGIVDNIDDIQRKGQVLIRGIDISKLSIKDLVSNIGFVYQNPKNQFFTDNSTTELVLATENLGYSKDESLNRLEKLTKYFDISNLLDRNVLELSGGEKQIICIVASLMANPDIVILDEPTSNLDINTIKKVRNILFKLKEMGKTILISEHRIYYLKGLVDRISLVNKGKIIKTYDASDFFKMDERKRVSLGLRTFKEVSICKKSNTSVENPTINLAIKNLKYSYKRGGNLLNIEKLNLYGGVVYFLLGENGQGKTTLGRILSGLVKQNEGKIEVDGKVVTCSDRLKLSYLVFQDVNTQLFTDSVKEEIKLNNDYESIDNLLNILNLYEKKDSHPQYLSGGEKQRTSIGAAIALNKRILIADEPTSGMDYENMINISKLLRKYAELGNIVLIISHDIEFINYLSDKIICLDCGMIKEYDQT